MSLPTRISWLAGGSFAGVLSLQSAALAQAPVAIVEDVRSTSAGLELMDYLLVGKVIRLESNDKLVLSYFASCWQETIVGGVVTVGKRESAVKDGNVERAKQRCDGGRMMLTAEEANHSGAMTFRAPPDKDRKKPASVNRAPTIFARSPVFEIARPGLLSIERLDKPGEKTRLEIASQQMTRGTFFDLAGSAVTLAPGGIYRASHDGRQVVFKIDAAAEAGPAPFVGRLVRFPLR